MTIGEIRKTLLSPSSGTHLALEDFYVLLAHASGKSREYLLAHPEHELETGTETHAREYFSRRLAHEPVAYITGEKEFFGLPFRVTRDTLIPRPETETLVEVAFDGINRLPSSASKKLLIADIGTGSGAIIVSLAHRLKTNDSPFVFHATDISQSALDVARENAGQHDVRDIISFHHGNLMEPIEKCFHNISGAVILANLPYLSKEIYESASEDIRRYEPRSALLAEEAGLALYRALLESLSSYSEPAVAPRHVVGFFEISPEQDSFIQKIFTDIFPNIRDYSVIPDLSGRSRIFRFSLTKT